MKTCIGVIGGSGLDNPDLFVPESQSQEETAFGLPSSPLRKGRLKESDIELVLLSRHGLGHTIPPHRVNHRANIAALKQAGCTHILATTACGSLREDLHPGMLVVPDQFIDATHTPVTFFETFAGGEIHHTIMADPFAPALRSALLASAQECGIPAHDGATLVSIAGPRFSTRAESRMYRSWGCDLINMTVAPEVPGVLDMLGEIRGECTLAIGHSDADYETAVRAIDAGVESCTHTFNVMSLFHQHRPAVMGAVLERDVFCEAICDGRHLHPGTVRMLLKCKGWDRVVAITDSMQAAGLPDGEYMLGVNPVTVTDGDAMISGTSIRAGSTLTLAQAVKKISAFTMAPPERVLPLLTLNPAKLIGEEHRRGEIAVGRDADFTVLSPELDVLATWSAGENIYAAAKE